MVKALDFSKSVKGLTIELAKEIKGSSYGRCNVVQGNIDGLSKSIIEELESIYEMEVPKDVF